MDVKTFIAFLLVLLTTGEVSSQEINFKSGNGLEISSIKTARGNTLKFKAVPLFTFDLDGSVMNSSKAKTSMIMGKTLLIFDKGLVAEFLSEGQLVATIKFINKGDDTLTLENVVPFGSNPEHTYITSEGPWSLTRAKLYRKGSGPINVILPDNAWELGYGSFSIDETHSLCGLCRRKEAENTQKHRYKTMLYPGGSLKYEFYFETFSGNWQEGIRKIFQEKYLYDLEEFDNSLFERNDLEWVRHTYVAGLNFAWDNDFYHSDDHYYTIRNYFKEGRKLFGGYDIYALWPTWPRLGLDERNQWDLFRDLPGGLPIIKQLADKMHAVGTRFFICFNPWDESTRQENPYMGIAAIIEATDADGVVLDCSGKSNERLQEIADSIKPGVIMYSEGMAVVKDMPGIVAGRVHNAIYYSPPLNLNKLIKPDFAIFRVLEIRDTDLKREVAISFFNGYGNELNSMGPGRPASVKNDLIFLGKTSMILRQNSNTFLSYDWVPLVPSLKDSIWVNKWTGTDKTLYTVLSFQPGGHQGALIKDEPKDGYQYLSLWRHEEIKHQEINGTYFLPVSIDPYPENYAGTRKEGNVDCLAAFPEYLTLDDRDHKLIIKAENGDRIMVWRGDPSYESKFMEYALTGEKNTIDGSFIAGEQKICIQLYEEDELIDERIYLSSAGKPWLISDIAKTTNSRGLDTQIYIEGGKYSFITEQNDQFIPYPGPSMACDTSLKGFYIDNQTVSNKQFNEFLHATSYKPMDESNFLKHWPQGQYIDSIADKPVVYISYDDARAYSIWANKRLPTELEWQYAAEMKDLDTGEVWEMTNDRYDNGSHMFVIIKGGSYYKPESSWWYIQGGKQPPQRQQMLLQVCPGFDRASTVGFRCVQDK